MNDMPRIWRSRPFERIIGGLPQDSIVMSGFEQGGRKVILGRARPIEEYALSYACPSPSFVQVSRAARRRRLPTMAKLRIGTTHELATVPNLPLIGSTYDKVRGMRRLGVPSFMGCWNFGNMLTANTAALNHFLRLRRLPSKRFALKSFACAYLPGCDAAKAARAWEGFSRAREESDDAWVCYHIFRSTWNAFRAFRLRRDWHASQQRTYFRSAADELGNLQRVLPIVERDRRFGWHSECQSYMFTAEGIRGKMAELGRQLAGAGKRLTSNGQ